jgi:hypothetical protein
MFRLLWATLQECSISATLVTMPPDVHYGLRGPPPSCGLSVTDFWGWDAREAQLRCPDEVDGYIWSTRKVLRPNLRELCQLLKFGTTCTWRNHNSQCMIYRRTGLNVSFHPQWRYVLIRKLNWRLEILAVYKHASTIRCNILPCLKSELRKKKKKGG